MVARVLREHVGALMVLRMLHCILIFTLTGNACVVSQSLHKLTQNGTHGRQNCSKPNLVAALILQELYKIRCTI